MCISSYTVFWILVYMMQSTQVALLVAAALWIAFLSALVTKRWLWVLCLSLFPVPALHLVFAVLTLVG